MTICERMACGESLSQICRSPEMPDRKTVYRWRLENEAFAKLYERARTILHEHWADEIIDISDDSRNDWVTREMRNGGTEKVVDHDHINRSRLMVDSRKWLLSKLRPEYGEKVRQEVTGKDGGPVETRELSDTEIARRIAFALAQGMKVGDGKDPATGG